MRVASADGRAVLIDDDGIVDVAAASNGALPADPQLLYEHWDEVRALAERVTSAMHRSTCARCRRRCPARARCSPSA